MVANAYRLPRPVSIMCMVLGEVQSITSLETEQDELRCDSIGIMLLGDLNPASNTSEADLMRDICRRKGLHQIVRQPTRGQYLLDLATTNIESASVAVMPKIADCNCCCAVKPDDPTNRVSPAEFVVLPQSGLARL